MIDTTKPTPNNKTFYMAISLGIIGLFLLLFVPCLIAMCIARCREKRQERRDALARQLEEGEGGEIFYGPFPEDHVEPPAYHVEELGESSGWHQPQQERQELDSSTQPIHQGEASAQQHYGHGEIHEPQYEGKGKSPVYPHQVQRAVVEQLPEYRQVKTAGRFQEHLPEAPEQLQHEQEAAEEYQDAQEVATLQQQRLNQKQKLA
ncbi:hypothetical protein V8C37DRAFT_400799 [Trichoderma ceciliae]